MIFDIFSKKQRKTKTCEKIRIIADIHEKDSGIISELVQLGAEVQTENLEIGDYLIGNTVAERKTFRDFVSSMLSKRLAEQLKQMQKYDSRILILEGLDFENLEKTKIHPNAVRGMILSASLDFKTPVIFTKDFRETANFLALLGKRQLKNPCKISMHSRKGKTKTEMQEHIVESFSGIGPKTAKKLLKKFGSVKKIIDADFSDLEKEIGKKAESFKIAYENY